jgi:hypothetical protein
MKTVINLKIQHPATEEYRYFVTTRELSYIPEVWVLDGYSLENYDEIAYDVLSGEVTVFLSLKHLQWVDTFDAMVAKVKDILSGWQEVI